jgi:hypothetical protein
MVRRQNEGWTTCFSILRGSMSASRVGTSVISWQPIEKVFFWAILAVVGVAPKWRTLRSISQKAFYDLKAVSSGRVIGRGRLAANAGSKCCHVASDSMTWESASISLIKWAS